MRSLRVLSLFRFFLAVVLIELCNFCVHAQVSITLPGTCNTCGAPNSPSSNGTAVITSISDCNAGTTGILTAGVPVIGVTQKISVVVGTSGTYNISATSNGVTFSGGGVLGTGNQTIILTANGSPTNSGSLTFSLNTNPSCSFIRNVTTSVTPLPTSIVLSDISPLFVASVYDQDYMPYTKSTTPADLSTGVSADGLSESTTLDIQGVIPTTGLTVSIPYIATGNVTLPAYSQTITIPASYTQDGISRDLTLSWLSTSVSSGSGYILAKVSSVGGALNVKKLDVQTGIGNDGLGFLLGQFSFPLNNTGTISSFDVRVVAGIPDRNFADTQHRFVYLPITSPTGKIWLNNNLGADYNNTASPYFNPGQQAQSFDDIHAYGSLFQWGRYSDGHELIDWNDPDAFYPKAGKTVALSGTSTASTTDTPNHNLFIAPGTSDWRNPSNNNLWQGVNGINNVCPVGWRVPTITELVAEATTLGMVSTEDAWRSKLAVPASGERGYGYNKPVLSNQARYIHMWSSTIGGTAGQSKVWQFIGPHTPDNLASYGNYPIRTDIESVRYAGRPVRCIMN